MRFLKGNVLFFALLLLAIMLFTYYALKESAGGGPDASACRISFAVGYDAGECEVFVDDS